MTTAERKLIVPPPLSIVKATELIPVIGYARVSTWREEMISVDIQTSVVNEAAARKGRIVTEWIIDEDATGRNFKRKVMRAIEIVEDGERPERELWSWKFSRFGRNRYGVAINLARIEEAGGALISATEDVDASTATGSFTRDMLFAVAAFESNRAGEQWKETHELRRNLGLPATGGKRFGYLWHPRRLPDGAGGWTLQDEWYEAFGDQAEYVADGYVDHIRGKIGAGKWAVRLNEAGLLNTRGEPWQDQTALWYLDSGFAAGLLRVHRKDTPCHRRGNCAKKDHHYFRPAEHESLIDGDTWENYWDRRTAGPVTPPRAYDPVYPLAGLVKCGLCQSMRRSGAGQIHKAKDDPGYGYRCGLRARHAIEHDPVYIRRRIVEARVREWLDEIAHEIDEIAAGRIALPTAPQLGPDVETKRKRLQSEVNKATRALDNATERYSLGDIPRDSYLRTRDKLTARRDTAQAKLDELPTKPAEPINPVIYRETVRGLIAEWDTISVASKRRTLAEVVRRVEIFPNDGVKVVPVWAPADPPQAKRPRAARRAFK